MVVTTSRPKNSNKPMHSKQSYTTKKNARRSGASIGKEAKKIRPDMQVSTFTQHKHHWCHWHFQ